MIYGEVGLTCSIYIALCEKDVTRSKSQIQGSDYILTDVYCHNHLGQTHDATFSDETDVSLVPRFEKWIGNIAIENPNIYGYANALYQSSIRPLAGYLNAIDAILIEKGKENVNFYLPVELMWKVKTSTYYLAEYESAGIHLYDRHAVLLPYIEQYLLAQGANIVSTHKTIPLQVGIFNIVRLWGVFLSKLLLDMKVFKREKRAANNNVNQEEGQVLLVRTVGQAITILPYLRSTTLKSTVIIGETYTDTCAFDFLSKNTDDINNITVISARQSKISRVLKCYAQGFKDILEQKKTVFEYKGLSINLTQAIKEVKVMMPSLALYQEKIKTQLKEVVATRLLTFEQKSAHAYIDASLAREQKIPSAQIQSCQQSFFNIPNPVCADYFLCETPEIVKSFQYCWPQIQEKLSYVGSFQGIHALSKKKKIIEKKSNIQLCFFTGVGKEVNLKLIGFLSEFCKEQSISLSVKLHPRDRVSYIKSFPDIDFYRDYEGAFYDFMSKFDLAITFPSGVISDLLYSECPFLVFIPEDNEYIHTESVFLPKNMVPIVNIENLMKAVLDIDETRRQHQAILASFKRDSGIITDINTIDENFEKLLGGFTKD
jgi:hypothetical protein